MLTDITSADYRKNYDYPIRTPSGTVVHPPKGRCWRYSKKHIEELAKDNLIWFDETARTLPRMKRYLPEYILE